MGCGGEPAGARDQGARLGSFIALTGLIGLIKNVRKKTVVPENVIAVE
jgi:hypothetical protein